MNILFTLLDYREITGSAMYVYELSRELVKSGHDATICSNIEGSELAMRSVKNGVTVVPYSFLLNPPTKQFDIIHASHKPVIENIIANDLLSNVPMVQTCHSEVLPKYEAAVIHGRVKAYIGIRESIVNQINASVFSEIDIKVNIATLENPFVELIPNPIDRERFNSKDISTEGYILFAGSIDYLRKNALIETIKYAKQHNLKVKVVGRNDYPHLQNDYPEVMFYQPTFEIEKFVKNCTMTAGIIFGRTAMEGYFCRKPYIDFQIDLHGNVTGSKRFGNMRYVDYEISNRNSKAVAEKVMQVYKQVLS